MTVCCSGKVGKEGLGEKEGSQWRNSMCEGPGAERSPKSGILRCGVIEEESDGGCSEEAAHGGP